MSFGTNLPGEAGVGKVSVQRQEGEKSCVVRPNGFKWQWRAIDGLQAKRSKKNVLKQGKIILASV